VQLHHSMVDSSLPPAHPTCLETAIQRLNDRPIKETTQREYLGTLRAQRMKGRSAVCEFIAALETTFPSDYQRGSGRR
jgi:hypothetical protein